MRRLKSLSIGQKSWPARLLYALGAFDAFPAAPQRLDHRKLAAEPIGAQLDELKLHRVKVALREQLVEKGAVAPLVAAMGNAQRLGKGATLFLALDELRMKTVERVELR